MTKIINIITIVLLIPWPIMFMSSPMMFGSDQPGRSTAALFVMIVLSYPIYIGILYLIFGLNFFSFSPTKFFFTTLISVLVITSVFGLPYKAIRNTLGYDLKGTVLRPGDAVYFDGKKINEIDVNSAQVNIPGDVALNFAVDKDHVYFKGQKLNGSHGPSFKMAPGKQDASFALYFMDQNQIYFEGTVLKGVQASNFKVTDYNKANDGSNYFIREKRIEAQGPLTQINNDYSHDGQSIFYGDKKVKGNIHLDSFKFIHSENSIASDENHVFVLIGDTKVEIPSINKETLKVLTSPYLKDNTHLYYINYSEARVEKVSVESVSSFEFIVGSHPFAKDDQHLYVLQNEKAIQVEGIDKDSFTIVPSNNDLTRLGYFKDRKNVYFFPRGNGDPHTGKFIIVEGADPTSFKQRSWHTEHRSNGFDKYRTYNDGVPLK